MHVVEGMFARTNGIVSAPETLRGRAGVEKEGAKGGKGRRGARQNNNK